MRANVLAENFDKWTKSQLTGVRGKLEAVFAAPLLVLAALNMSFDAANAQNSTQRPERPRPDRDRNEIGLRLVPLIPPSEAIEYAVIPSDERITGRLGSPAARLVNVPSELNEIAVWTPTGAESSSSTNPNDIAFKLISSVRYKGAGKELVIATYQLSPAAARLRRDTRGLDDNLPDGTPARVAVVEQGDYPNRVVFERGNSIIVVGGNLPIEEIKQLAATANLR